MGIGIEVDTDGGFFGRSINMKPAMTDASRNYKRSWKQRCPSSALTNFAAGVKRFWLLEFAPGLGYVGFATPMRILYPDGFAL